MLIFAEYRLDQRKRILLGTSGVVRLEPRVLELLLYLVRNRDRAVSKQELLERVWSGVALERSAIPGAVKKLRHALGSAREIIATVRGYGFRFAASAVELPDADVAGQAEIYDTPHRIAQATRGNPTFDPCHGAADFGAPEAGPDMTFDFPTPLAHASATRSVGSGTILGSSTVSDRDPALGCDCIAKCRRLELIEPGHARTLFLRPGDRVRIEMRDRAGRSVFGVIDQRVEPLGPAARARG